MINSIRPSTPESIVPAEKPDLNIVALYDTFLAGHLARRAYSDPRPSANGHTTRQLSLWKLDFLSRPPMKHFVIEDAVSADLLVLAMEESEPLESHVIEWLETWLTVREPKPATLIACLMTRRHQYIDPEGCVGQLKSIAARAGIDFHQNVLTIVDEDLRLLTGSTV